MTETKVTSKKTTTTKKRPNRMALEIKGIPTMPGIVNAVNILKEQGKEVDQASLSRAIDQAVDATIT